MANAGTIQGEFGWSNSPLIEGMRQAPEIVERGARSVEQRFAAIFKKSKAARGERAVTNLISDLTSGNIAQGLGEFAGRLTGLGVAASLGIGAAVVLFEKFRGQIKETKEAHAALAGEMIRRPLSVVTKFSAEGMNEVLAAREKLANDLRTKQEASGFGSALWSGIKSALSGPSLGGISDKTDAANQKQMQMDLNRYGVEREQILLAQANAAQTLVDIQQMEAEGDKRLAGHAKSRLEKEQAIAALRTQGLTPDAFNMQSGALQQKQGLKDRQIDAEFNAKERGLVIEEKIANLRSKGLTTEDEKKIRATSELKDLDTQIANETSPQQLRELKLKRRQKMNELRAFGNPNAMAESDNPFAFGTIAAREFDNSKGFGSISQRNSETNNASVWGSLGYSAAQRGEMPLPKNDPATIQAEVLKEVRTSNEILRAGLLSDNQ